MNAFLWYFQSSLQNFRTVAFCGGLHIHLLSFFFWTVLREPGVKLEFFTILVCLFLHVRTTEIKNTRQHQKHPSSSAVDIPNSSLLLFKLRVTCGWTRQKTAEV